ncbi:hypothetical protein TNCV_1960121 [Trichonephila clavipes]|nr:hypothetical protein TNCV_1960121 [Trichonephila clavipes]
MERSYLFFLAPLLLARTMYPIIEEKLRFHRSHLFAGNIVEIVRIDTSSQVFVSDSNLYTGGIFVDGFQPLHRRNICRWFQPLHRRNVSFRKMAARLSTDGFCSRSKL